MDHVTPVLLAVGPIVAAAGMGAAVHGRIRLVRVGDGHQGPPAAWAAFLGGTVARVGGVLTLVSAAVRLVF